MSSTTTIDTTDVVATTVDTTDTTTDDTTDDNTIATHTTVDTTNVVSSTESQACIISDLESALAKFKQCCADIDVLTDKTKHNNTVTCSVDMFTTRQCEGTVTSEDLKRVFDIRSKILNDNDYNYLIDFLTVKNNKKFTRKECEVLDFTQDTCAYHIFHLDIIFWYPKWMYETLLYKKGLVQISKTNRYGKFAFGASGSNHVYSHAMVLYLHQLTLPIESQDSMIKERITTEGFKATFKRIYGKDHSESVTEEVKKQFESFKLMKHDSPGFITLGRALGRYVQAMYTGCAGGEGKKKMYNIDHINRDPFDIRECNLKLVTAKENRKNQKNDERLFSKVVLKNIKWD